MANRFVEFKPLDYKPSTYPLELLNETVKERRKLLDASEEAFDALNQFRSIGIAGTAYEKEAAAINKEWQNRKNEVKDFIAKNPGDVYAQIRKIKELQRGITNDLLTGKAGAVKRAYDDFSTSYQELLKHADKKDSYTASRLSDAVYMFKKGLQDLGGFNPETGRYNKESSFAAPPPEFDVYSRLTEVLKNTPELKKYSLVPGRDGYTLVDRTTGIEYKEGKTLVQNMLGALQGDAHYMSDLGFRARLEAAKGDITDSNDINAITQKLFQNDYGQIAGYAYVNDVKPDLHRMKDPALDLRMHREKLGSIQQLQRSLVDLSTPRLEETLAADVAPNSDQSREFFKAFEMPVSADSPFKYFFNQKAEPIADRKIDLTRDATTVENLATYIEVKSEGSITKQAVKDYIKRLTESVRYASPHEILNGLSNNLGDRSKRVSMKGYILPGDGQDITRILLNNLHTPVYIMNSNGTMYKNGSDYTVGNLLNDYPDLKPNKYGKYTTTAGHFVPPTSVIKKFSYSMPLPGGKIAYIAPVNQLNDARNATSNFIIDAQNMKINPRAYMKNGVTYPGSEQSPIMSYIQGKYMDENKITQFKNVLAPFAQITGYKLYPKNLTELGTNGVVNYNKVVIVGMDHKGNPIERTAVEAGSPLYAGTNDQFLDLGGKDDEVLESLSSEIFTKQHGELKMKMVEGNQFLYQQLNNPLNFD